MRQWEIYLYPFDREQVHPAVILSGNERCLNSDLEAVNALICTTARLNREPKRHEVILDESDGLDWRTAVRCDVVYLLPKAGFAERRGMVSSLRQREIARRLVEVWRLPIA